MHPIKKAQTAVAKYWVRLWPRHKGYVNYDDFTKEPNAKYMVDDKTGMIGTQYQSSITDEDGDSNARD